MLDSLIELETKTFNHTAIKERPDPTFIPIHLTGGIGDVIMAIDVVRFLQQRFQIAVYTKHLEAFKYFYSYDIPAFENIPEFSWKLELNTLARFKITDSFYGFSIDKHQDLFLKQQSLFKSNPLLRTLYEPQFGEKFFLISNYAKFKAINRRDFPLFTLGYEDYPKPPNYEKNKPDKYITIHDGYDTQYKQTLVKDRATKQWHLDHWESLVKAIKQTYPSYKIIQLGSSTARPIEGIHKSLINKTTISQAFDILKNSSLHIDGDSGLTHAATRLQTPCITLWGPTPIEFYSYNQNINIKSDVCNQACYGLKPNWNDKCPIGYEGPRCMDEITSDHVMGAVESQLGPI